MHTIEASCVTPGRVEPVWSVAIIASRESVVDVLATIRAAVVAAVEPTVIDVLTNGSSALSEGLISALKSEVIFGSHVQVRIWYTPLADKSNVWNHFVHTVWPGAITTFFLDGHCRVNPVGFQRLTTGLQERPLALAGSGVPSVGRTADKWRQHLIDNGGMVGGFLALPRQTMSLLRQKFIRLPLGLYGFDGVLRAIFAYGFNPKENQWNVKDRIFVQPDSTWLTTPKKWWRFTDIKDQFKRNVRISLRFLVGQATHEFFTLKKGLPEQLPRTTQDFVVGWADRNPKALAYLFLEHPLCMLSLHKARKPQDWTAAEIQPVLLWHSPVDLPQLPTLACACPPSRLDLT